MRRQALACLLFVPLAAGATGPAEVLGPSDVPAPLGFFEDPLTRAPIPRHWVPLDRFGPTGEGVVNGTVASANQYPQTVALGWLASPTYGFIFCSGTLIDPNWVLTAAHCVEGQGYESYGFELTVLFGPGGNQGFSDAIENRRYFGSPEYNPQQFTDDIGLIELSRAKTDVPPMVINDEPVNNSWVGTVMEFAGFGITSDSANDSGTKRFADMTVYDYDFSNIYNTDPTQNLCSGDSGGSAYEVTPSGLELAGVNAFVFPSCVGGDNGVTRVDTHIPWILSYAPNAPLSQGEVPTTPGGTGTEPTDGPGPLDTGLPPAAVASGEWSDPVRPGPESYPKGCALVGGAPLSAAGLAGAAALLARRRRRAFDTGARRA